MGKKEEILVLLNREIKGRSCNNYIFVFFSLLSCSEKEAIELLRKYHISKQDYNDKLKKFSNKFPDYKEEREKLEEIYQRYLDMYYPKKEEKKVEINNIENEKLLNTFLNSGDTIEEFCSKYGYRMSEIYGVIYKLPVSKRKEVQENLKEKNNDSLVEIMRQMVKEICLNPNFDIIDYYQYTHLVISDFRTVFKEYFGELNPKLTRKVVVFLQKYGDFTKKIMNYDKIMHSNMCIENRTIDTTEKQKVLNYLEQQNIPLCFYLPALKKYIKNPEYFEDNQKVKRK